MSATTAKRRKSLKEAMRAPAYRVLMDTLIACQWDLRDLGGDWESGIPGTARLRILRAANRMLRVTRGAEPPRPPPVGTTLPTRRSWLIIHDLTDLPA